MVFVDGLAEVTTLLFVPVVTVWVAVSCLLGWRVDVAAVLEGLAYGTA